jgi:hypothetical protein
METAPDWETLGDEAGRDRRIEKRIALAFPIEVSGFDRAGNFFAENTTTADISESGCRFSLITEVLAKTVVALKLLSRRGPEPQPDKPLLFKIAWVSREKDRWMFGAMKLQKESVWCVAFPHREKTGSAVA